MKRIFLIAALLLIVFALLAACGEDGSTETPEINSLISAREGEESTQPTTADTAITEAPKTLTVMFNSNGGSEVAAQSVEKGEKTEKPADPEKAGYTFAGWTYQGEPWSFIGYSVTADMTLDANWTPITYFITYDLAGGTMESNPNPTEYTIESNITFTGTPEKTNYVFAGWNISYIPRGSYGNKTITARWTPAIYTITYNLGGGTNAASNPTTYTVESNTIMFANPTRMGYDFTGWDIATIPSGSTGNQTITASWTPIVYTITYDLAGGTMKSNPNPTEYTTESETITFTGTPTRAGYVFARWETNYSKTIIPSGSYGNIIVTARWNAIFTVSGNSITGLTSSGKSLIQIDIPSEIDGISITSIGDGAFYNCRWLTSITIPHSVTSIGYSAFYGCTGLTSITIPDSVTSIGNFAFSGCTGLKSVTIPNSVTSIGGSAFSGCSSLTSITIPFVGAQAGVTASNTYQYPFGYFFGTGAGTAATQYYYGSSTSSTTSTTYYIPSSLKSVTVTGGNILYGAFYNCSRLTSITIPDGVTSIGDYAFYGCTGLTSITIPDGVTSIGDYAFYGCTGLTSITIPDSVTSIGQYAFYNCRRLTSITIPDSVTSIGDQSFYGCPIETAKVPAIACNFINNDKLRTVVITSGTSIGRSAFYGCTGLTSITIPDSVTSIENFAFKNCTSLTSITIPDSVTSIGSYAFSYCTGLTSITIPDSVTSIGIEAFSYCTGLTSITIPDSVTSIRNSAFYGCTGLTSITIPDSVTRIENNAFRGCSGLTSVTIPDSVTRIESDAFYGCPIEIAKVPAIACSIVNNDKLSTVVITSGTSISDSAFSNCSDLISITIPDSVTSIGRYAFINCHRLTSIIFEGTKKRWGRISTGSDWNYKTGNYTIHCTDGDIEKY